MGVLFLYWYADLSFETQLPYDISKKKLPEILLEWPQAKRKLSHSQHGSLFNCCEQNQDGSLFNRCDQRQDGSLFERCDWSQNCSILISFAVRKSPLSWNNCKWINIILSNAADTLHTWSSEGFFPGGATDNFSRGWPKDLSRGTNNG